jgi:hypothetical protein
MLFRTIVAAAAVRAAISGVRKATGEAEGSSKADTKGSAAEKEETSEKVSQVSDLKTEQDTNLTNATISTNTKGIEVNGEKGVAKVIIDNRVYKAKERDSHQGLAGVKVERIK